MSQRTITSAGVQVFEKDLSLIAPTNAGTNVFITGYANSGPTDEILKITSQEELESIYGYPTNSAERYFYHGIKELLKSPANIYTSRLPYGSGSGVGFGSQYSVLAYPGLTYSNTTSAVGTNFDTLTSGLVILGAPTQFTIDESTYRAVMDGSSLTWSVSSNTNGSLSAFSDLGKAALLVINKAQATINPQFEGYYVGIADNFNINPATAHQSVIGVKTVSTSASVYTPAAFTTVPTGTLQFTLTGAAGSQGSVSQILESLTDYDIDGREDDDVLSVGVFKLRKSLYATEAFKMDYVLEDRIVGSTDSHRQQQNPTGGPAVPFFIETRDTNSRNVEIMVNPYISAKNKTTTLDSNNQPKIKVRVLTNYLISQAASNPSKIYGLKPEIINSDIASKLSYADNLYPVGSYSNQTLSDKVLGSIPTKIERALEGVKNDEIYDIDVVVEAGLGTIYVATEQNGTTYYDDTVAVPTVSSLQTSSDLGATGQDVRADYHTIFNIFENFCNLPVNTGGRGDCVFIADPLRHLLVVGKNTKVLSDKSKSFQQYAYWGMRHQFELANSSYAAVYGNWAQVYDDLLGEKVWVPFSSVAAAIYAKSDALEFPWAAPAGFTRGLVNSQVVDLAITPNQKQRDELYKSNINPVLFSPTNGMAIFGQKTLQRKPSAFDRVNVRRCFQWLERAVKKAAIYFVFEPNTEFTRTRFVNTMAPIFEYAKNNQGIYDYMLVCDERNNTAQVIDSNEMKFDAYIKPVRTAEYILCTFVASRTDAVFNELI